VRRHRHDREPGPTRTTVTSDVAGDNGGREAAAREHPDTGHGDTRELEHIRFSGWSAAALPRPSRSTAAEPPSQHLSPEVDPEPLHELLRVVLSASGLDPDHYRSASMIRRIPACLRALGVQTPEQALDRLRQRPELLACALDTLLIGVSEFFRDPGVVAALAQWLPVIARQRDRHLRAWSAGCGGGAELYSLAILLDQAGLLAGSILLGTDCRATAIAEANRGVFHEREMGKVPAAVRDRYFRPQGEAFRVVLPAQGRITWEVRNALGERDEGEWDVILCRNVAIYLKRRSSDHLWTTLVSCLRPGGLLVVGDAERPAIPDLTLLNRCIYRKSGGSDA